MQDSSPQATAPQVNPTAGDEAEPTGVASVDAAVEQLRGLDQTPVEAHVEIFDDVQRRLHDALAELDDGQ